MTYWKGEDWLRVVYGSGVGERPRAGRGPGAGAGADITIHQSPSELNLAQAPGGEQRVRVTVVPKDPTLGWSLYLWDFGAGPGRPSTSRVWWRVEPGAWELLVGTRQCATGQGRARVDVELRVERDLARDAVPPRLRFVAESIVGR